MALCHRCSPRSCRLGTLRTRACFCTLCWGCSCPFWLSRGSFWTGRRVFDYYSLIIHLCQTSHVLIRSLSLIIIIRFRIIRESVMSLQSRLRIGRAARKAKCEVIILFHCEFNGSGSSMEDLLVVELESTTYVSLRQQRPLVRRKKTDQVSYFIARALKSQRGK